MSIRRGFKRLGKLAFILLPLFVATVFVFQRPIVDIAAASDSYPAEWTAFSPLGPAPAKKWGNDSPLWSPLLALPSDVGQWSGIINWNNQGAPFVAVHAAMMPDGRILLWDRDDFNTNSAQIWNPNTGVFTPVPFGQADLFCSGFALLSDGRLILAGGHVNNTDNEGLNQLNTFNTRTFQWSPVPIPMHVGRWYPTVTTLRDGRLLITGGAEHPDGGATFSQGTDARNQKPKYISATTVEVFNPRTNRTAELTKAASLKTFYYPQIYLMPSGNRVFMAAQDDLNFTTTDDKGHSFVLDVDSQTWTDIGLGYGGMGTSSVSYTPGKILSTGGVAGNVFSSTNHAAIFDLNTLTWNQNIPQMNYTRLMHTLVVLPDGSVMAVGGSVSVYNQPAYEVLQPEIWNPETAVWTNVAPMQTPRMYHSIALLLPSGQVLVAGGGRNPEYVVGVLMPQHDEPSAEIYSPPYLFKGARPAIISVKSIQGGSITVGSKLQIETPQAASIHSAALISLPAVTHGFNENQRYIPLTLLERPLKSVKVQLPVNRNYVPPGYYMLFILNRDGVPSVASIVRVD